MQLKNDLIFFLYIYLFWILPYHKLKYSNVIYALVFKRTQLKYVTRTDTFGCLQCPSVCLFVWERLWNGWTDFGGVFRGYIVLPGK